MPNMSRFQVAFCRSGLPVEQAVLTLGSAHLVVRFLLRKRR